MPTSQHPPPHQDSMKRKAVDAPSTVANPKRVTWSVDVTADDIRRLSFVPKRARRDTTKRLVATRTDFDRYIQKQALKQALSGYKYTFLARVCRRYVFLKSVFSKWRGS